MKGYRSKVAVTVARTPLLACSHLVDVQLPWLWNSSNMLSRMSVLQMPESHSMNSRTPSISSLMPLKSLAKVYSMDFSP